MTALRSQLEEALRGKLHRLFLSDLGRVDALLDDFLQNADLVFLEDRSRHQDNQEVLEVGIIDRVDLLCEE